MVRTELDLRNEKISYKVREHSNAKAPVIFIVGNKEVNERTVSIRRLGSRDLEYMSFDQALKSILEEIRPPF